MELIYRSSQAHPGTLELSAGPEDVHRVVRTERPRILQPPVARVAVAHEPGRSALPRPGKVRREPTLLILILGLVIIVCPPPAVGGGQGAVLSVGRGPVCLTVQDGSVLGALKLIHEPQLVWSVTHKENNDE